MPMVQSASSMEKRWRRFTPGNAKNSKQLKDWIMDPEKGQEFLMTMDKLSSPLVAVKKV